MKRGASRAGGRGYLATLVRSRGAGGARRFFVAPRRVVVKIGATIPPDGKGWTEQ